MWKSNIPIFEAESTVSMPKTWTLDRVLGPADSGRFEGTKLSGEDFVRTGIQFTHTQILYTDRTMLRDEVTHKLEQLEREGRILTFDPVRQSDDVIEAIVRIPRERFDDDNYREHLRDEVRALERDDQLISVSILWSYERRGR